MRVMSNLEWGFLVNAHRSVGLAMPLIVVVGVIVCTLRGLEFQELLIDAWHACPRNAGDPLPRKSISTIGFLCLGASENHIQRAFGNSTSSYYIWLVSENFFKHTRPHTPASLTRLSGRMLLSARPFIACCAWMKKPVTAVYRALRAAPFVSIRTRHYVCQKLDIRL